MADFRILEPSFGRGDFILPIANRLLASAKREPLGLTYDRLSPAIRAIELHHATFEHTRSAMHTLMLERGVKEHDAVALLELWLTQGDFLLSEFTQEFTHAVGNPPYVRQETVPDILMGEYRRRYSTIYDRADVYIPFIERSLRLLAEGGRLGFICADRWTKNRYGKKLRALISKDYALSTYVDMVDADAFHSEVSAYPAITVIERRIPGQRAAPTRIYARPKIDSVSLNRLSEKLTAKTIKSPGSVREVAHVAVGSDPWILSDFEARDLVSRIEAELPTLEQVGCKVGIGVATGADKAFIGSFDDLDVEEDRKLPLVMTKDIRGGCVEWGGMGVINPFDYCGKLVRLEDFPRLNRYLEERRDLIANRQVAVRSPRNWYRTIDRIYPEFAAREKLLIPDIQEDASIVYEGGKLYPHHNLYYITSTEWNVRALLAVLQCGIARLFVSLYSTRMRGDYLRFQAQHLRRIRVPRWENVDKPVRKRLVGLSQSGDRRECVELVSQLYDFSTSERELVEERSAL